MTIPTDLDTPTADGEIDGDNVAARRRVKTAALEHEFLYARRHDLELLITLAGALSKAAAKEARKAGAVECKRSIVPSTLSGMSHAETSPPKVVKRDKTISLNVALWIAAVPVALAAVRLLTFSKGDPVLLRVLFENFQILPLLTASTLLVLPWATLTTALVMLLNRSARHALLLWVQRIPVLATLAIFVGAVVVMTSPFPMAFLIAGAWLMVLAVAIIGRVDRPWAKRLSRIVNYADNDTPGGMFYSVVIVPLIFTILPSWSSFWLPLEDVVTAEDTHHAYVLGDSDGWTTLLTDDRVVLRVRSAEITDRIVCDQGEAVTLQLLGERGDAPQCAK